MKKSIADINEIRDRMQRDILTRTNVTAFDAVVAVNMTDGAIAAGAEKLFDILIDGLVERAIPHVKVIRTTELGDGSVIRVTVPGEEAKVYENPTEEFARELIQKL